MIKLFMFILFTIIFILGIKNYNTYNQYNETVKILNNLKNKNAFLENEISNLQNKLNSKTPYNIKNNSFKKKPKNNLAKVLTESSNSNIQRNLSSSQTNPIVNKPLEKKENIFQVHTGYGRTSTSISENPYSFKQEDNHGFLYGAGYSRRVLENTYIGATIFSNQDFYLTTSWGF